MLDHLTGEMRDTVTSRDLMNTPPPTHGQPINSIPVGFAECPLPLALPQPDILTQDGPSNFSSPGSFTNGRNAGDYPLLDGPPEVPIPSARAQSSGMLISDAQPPGWSHSRGRKLPLLCTTPTLTDMASALLKPPITSLCLMAASNRDQEVAGVLTKDVKQINLHF